jgi:hypothetical protein
MPYRNFFLFLNVIPEVLFFLNFMQELLSECHTGTFFVSDFRTGTSFCFRMSYQTSFYSWMWYRNFFLFLNFVPALISIYHIHLYFSVFLAGYPCFAFKKHTGTSELLFRALFVPMEQSCYKSLTLRPRMRWHGGAHWTRGEEPVATWDTSFERGLPECLFLHVTAKIICPVS